MRKYVLDANCYIDASRDAEALSAMQEFVARVAPGLYVSSIVAAELLGGARSTRDRKLLEDRLLGPFVRHDRMLTPGASAWEALGRALAFLREREGLQLPRLSRSFAFDILLAHSCREHGMVLITNNRQDMARIRRVFSFEYLAPYPTPT